MTCGIYLIYTMKKKKVTSFYIGKSKNIEQRITQHTKKLKSGEHTVKLSSVSVFEYCILRECHPDYLDALERDYFEAANSAYLEKSSEPIFDIEDVPTLVPITILDKCLNTQNLVPKSTSMEYHYPISDTIRNQYKEFIGPTLKAFKSRIYNKLKSKDADVSAPLF